MNFTELSKTSEVLLFLLMKRPKIIAHRGYWNTDDCVENTIKALKQAQQLDIYGSEFDVRMSKDGVPLIYHDEFLEGNEISKSDFKTLFSAFKVARHGFLPTLENYLTYGMKVPSHRLVMEIKDIDSIEEEFNLFQSVIYLIEKLRMQDRLEYISFSLNICRLLKEWSESAIVSYLGGDLSPIEISEYGLNGLNYEFKIWKQNPDWISESKKLRLRTGCWTVNDVKEFFELAEMGIDFVTTDRPDLLLDFSAQIE